MSMSRQEALLEKVFEFDAAEAFKGWKEAPSKSHYFDICRTNIFFTTSKKSPWEKASLPELTGTTSTEKT